MKRANKTTTCIAVVTTTVFICVAIMFIRFSVNHEVVSLDENYRTDKQPIINRLGNTLEFESCYWKSGLIGNRGIGPSSYWISGFLKLTDECFLLIMEAYSFSQTEVEFDNNMSPYVTGFDDFAWFGDEKLTNVVLGTGYIGEVYIDLNNKILYFYLENK